MTGVLLGVVAPLPPLLTPSHSSIVLGALLLTPPALLRGAPLPPGTEKCVAVGAPFPPPPAVLRISFPPLPFSSTPIYFSTPSHNRWELPDNYPVSTVVMVIYNYVERTWIIIVTPNFCITYMIMNKYDPGESVNIHIK